jgi:hypothetical protein
MILRAPVIPLFSDLLRSAKINGFLQYITEVSVWPANKRNRKEMVPLPARIHHSLQRPPKKKCFFRFVLVPRPSQSSAISPKRMLGHGHEARTIGDFTDSPDSRSTVLINRPTMPPKRSTRATSKRKAPEAPIVFPDEPEPSSSSTKPKRGRLEKTKVSPSEKALGKRPADVPERSNKPATVQASGSSRLEATRAMLM